MKRSVAAIAAAALALAAPTATAETVVKLATFAPAGSAYHDALVELKRDWEAISGGEVVLQIYAGGVAGDESDMVRKMRVGQLQAATLTSGGLPDIDPGFRAFQVPMMFRSVEEFRAVTRRLAPRLDGLLAKNGFRSLGWADAGWLHFFTRRPVALPDDLRTQPVFVWSGADRFVEAWRNGGFQPRQLPATDIHLALQSRMLDAVSAPPLIALANQWFAEVPHMTTLRWVPLMGSLVITEKGWQALPSALRPRLAEAALRAAGRIRDEAERANAEAVAVMRRHGLVVHEASEAEAEIWRAEVRSFFGPLIGGYIDTGLVREIEQVLHAHRAGG